MKDYFFEKSDELKNQMQEYVLADIDLFLQDFYILCYNSYYLFEYDKIPTDIDFYDSNDILNILLEFKKALSNIPIKDLKSNSCVNHFWNVSDIFNVEPKRFGLYGDEVIWNYMRLFFELFNISIDLVKVEYVIGKAREILDIYYKYAKHYDADFISEYWNKVIDELIKVRYDCFYNEMKLLMDY